jgi:hypothetical protein
MNGLPKFFWDSSGYRRPLPYRIGPGGRHMPRGAYVSTLEFGKGGCTIEGQESDTKPIQYESFIVCEDRDLNKYYDQLREHLHTPPELICKLSALGNDDSVEVFLD